MILIIALSRRRDASDWQPLAEEVADQRQELRNQPDFWPRIDTKRHENSWDPWPFPSMTA